MKLTLLPDKKIRKKSKKVNFPLSKEKIKLIENMIKYIDDSQKMNSKYKSGVGIAAVQVGHLDRMYYINAPSFYGQKPWKEFLINPVILKKSKKACLKEGEGCLSVDKEIPGQEGLVHRSYEVVVKGYSYFSKKEIQIKKNGYHAIIIQHEQDHLNGILFLDRINKFKIWEKEEDETLI